MRTVVRFRNQVLQTSSQMMSICSISEDSRPIEPIIYKMKCFSSLEWIMILILKPKDLVPQNFMHKGERVLETLFRISVVISNLR